MTKNAAEPDQRLPGLDGLRALAVWLVIYSHVALAHHVISDWIDGFSVQLGPLGVDVFFVVSGFIITVLLLRERSKTGRISLRRFYARRAIRLWPTLWLYVGVVAIVDTVITPRALITPLVFMSDYMLPLNGPDTATFHTWSLSCEEQFYLLWPALLIFIPRKHLGKLLIALFVLAPLVRTIDYYAIPAWRGFMPYQFQTRYDFLVIGCLLALDYQNGWALIARLKRFRGLILVVATGVAFGVEAKMTTPVQPIWFLYLIGYSLQAVSIALIVGIVVSTGRKGVVGWVLNSRLMVHMGAISYGLYLWQMLFTLAAVPPFTNPLVGLPSAIACAEISWWLLDKPLMRLRRRLRGTRAQPVGQHARAETLVGVST